MPVWNCPRNVGNFTISLSKTERMELTKQATSRTDRAEDARRAQVVLMLADGHTWDEVCDRLDCSRGFIASWNKRFREQRFWVCTVAIADRLRRHSPRAGSAHPGCDPQAPTDRWHNPLEHAQAWQPNSASRT